MNFVGFLAKSHQPGKWWQSILDWANTPTTGNLRGLFWTLSSSFRVLGIGFDRKDLSPFPYNLLIKVRFLEIRLSFSDFPSLKGSHHLK